MRGALACGMGSQQAQAALAWGVGRAGRAAGGARQRAGRGSARGAAARGARQRADLCEARVERSGRAGARGAQGGRLGVPVRTWACQLGQLGARAPGLVFRPGFRLGDVFESPFEPGS